MLRQIHSIPARSSKASITAKKCAAQASDPAIRKVERQVTDAPRPAGTIAAAAFLENFTGDWPWAHIDIASVDLEKSGTPYVPKGATGFGLRLLVEVLSNWKKL